MGDGSMRGIGRGLHTSAWARVNVVHSLRNKGDSLGRGVTVRHR